MRKQKCIFELEDHPELQARVELDLDHNLFNNIRILCTSPKSKEDIRKIIPDLLFSSIQNGENSVIDRITAVYYSPATETKKYLDLRRSLAGIIMRYSDEDYEIYGFPKIIISIKKARCKVFDSKHPEKKEIIKIDVFRSVNQNLFDLRNSASGGFEIIPYNILHRMSLTDIGENNVSVTLRINKKNIVLHLDPNIPLYEQYTNWFEQECQDDSLPEMEFSFPDEEKVREERRKNRRRGKKTIGKTRIICAIVVLLIGVGLLSWKIFSDRPARLVKEALQHKDYDAAVKIYNSDIKGNEKREESVELLFEEQIDSIEKEYESEVQSYDDTILQLNTLYAIGNEELSSYAAAHIILVDLYEGNNSELVQVYNTSNIYDKDLKDKIDSLLENKIEVIFDSYLNSNISYEEAIENLSYFAQLKNETISEKASDQLNNVERYYTAKKCFDEGNKKYKASEYQDAIVSYKKIPKGTDLYDKAQERIEECCEKIISSLGSSEDIDKCLDNIIVLLNLKELSDRKSVDKALQQAKDQCTAIVTKEVNKLKKQALFGDAIDIIDKVSEVYESNDLIILKEDLIKEEAAAKFIYEAAPVDFISEKGEIRSDDDVDEYSFTAMEEGIYCLTFSEMQYEFSVYVDILDKNGQKVHDGNRNVANDDTIFTNVIPAGDYTIRIQHRSNTGSYEFTIGQQKSPVPIDAYNVIKDSIEFDEQENHYIFKPGVSGKYRFDFSELYYGTNLNITIFDHLRKPTKETVSNESGFTIVLDEDETYDVCVKQREGLTNYTMTIGKPKASKMIKYQEKVTGSITYVDQEDMYTFVPSSTKKYYFEGNAENWGNWHMRIIDENNNPIELDSEDDAKLSADMTAKKQYTIICYYADTFTDYSFTIR